MALSFLFFLCACSDGSSWYTQQGIEGGLWPTGSRGSSQTKRLYRTESYPLLQVNLEADASLFKLSL